MSDIPPDDSWKEELFSWEQWFRVGVRAFKRALSRYQLGMPDEFWQHLEKSFTEFLAAMRIALQTIQNRRRGSPPPSSPGGSAIDIEWDDDEWD